MMDSMTIFFQSRQIESFQEVLLHSSEDFRLCVHVGVVFHRAVQVIAVARKVGMHHLSEHAEYSAVGCWLSVCINQQVFSAKSIDNSDHGDS